MPITECDNCGGAYEWRWEEAFEKFGFNDGDGQVETWQVESVLVEAGYTVKVIEWGLHNTIIQSIKKDGFEYMPLECELNFTVGYDDPRDYLPTQIVQLLDEKL